jgi:Ca2+-binding EF-hand superfamily protein
MKSGKVATLDPSKSKWNPGELSKILAEIHPLFEQKVSIAYKNVRNAWLKIDEDSSGSLSHEEFMAIFAKFNLVLRPEQKAKLFDLFDPMGTGYVVYDRFNQVIGQVNTLALGTSRLSPAFSPPFLLPFGR